MVDVSDNPAEAANNKLMTAEAIQQRMVSGPAESYAFVDGDLAAGILTLSYGSSVPGPYYYRLMDNLFNEISVGATYAANGESFAIDLSSVAPIDGTWTLKVRRAPAV